MTCTLFFRVFDTRGSLVPLAVACEAAKGLVPFFAGFGRLEISPRTFVLSTQVKGGAAVRTPDKRGRTIAE